MVIFIDAKLILELIIVAKKVTANISILETEWGAENSRFWNHKDIFEYKKHNAVMKS